MKYIEIDYLDNILMNALEELINSVRLLMTAQIHL